MFMEDHREGILIRGERFDLMKTLRSGQMFRYRELHDGVLFAMKDRIVAARFVGDGTLFLGESEDSFMRFGNIWILIFRWRLANAPFQSIRSSMKPSYSGKALGCCDKIHGRRCSVFALPEQSCRAHSIAYGYPCRKIWKRDRNSVRHDASYAATGGTYGERRGTACAQMRLSCTVYCRDGGKRARGRSRSRSDWTDEYGGAHPSFASTPRYRSQSCGLHIALRISRSYARADGYVDEKAVEALDGIAPKDWGPYPAVLQQYLFFAFLSTRGNVAKPYEKNAIRSTENVAID